MKTTRMCRNCKYFKTKDYVMIETYVCLHPNLIKMEQNSSGSLVKIHPKCDEVCGEIGKCCDKFSESFWFKVRRFFSKIKEYYYKRRHPEWFL